MKKTLQTFVEVGRIGSVLIALFAMLVAGLPVFDRLAELKFSADLEAEVQQIAAAPAPDELSLAQGEEPEPEKTAGNMTPGSEPNCDPPALLSSVSAAKPVSSSEGEFSKNRQNGLVFDRSLEETKTSPVVACLCQVGSQVGHQFTLVGARPSGTS